MSFKDAFAENNVELRGILETVNGLPDYVEPKKFNLETIVSIPFSGYQYEINTATYITPYINKGYYLRITPLYGSEVVLPMEVLNWVDRSPTDPFFNIEILDNGTCKGQIRLRRSYSKFYIDDNGSGNSNGLSLVLKSLEVVK